MAELARVSPLAAFAERFAAAAVPGVVRFAELPFTVQLTLRLDPATPAADAVERVLGGALPLAPSTTAVHGEHEVLWMGPDEWLIAAPAGSDALEPELRAALDGHHAAVVDVSGQRTQVEVAGSAVTEILSRGCALDLHPSVFPVGRCAQTLLGRNAVILVARGGEPVYGLFVRASFAEYAAEWLLDASVEERAA